MTPSLIPKFAITAIGSESADVVNPRLAATIYAFDVPLHPENPFSVTAGDGIQGRRTTWHFHQTDPAGNAPGDIVKRWHDTKWLDENPQHPLAVCKRAFAEHDQLKHYLKLGRGLDSHYGPACAVSNTRKAAVLAALDHPLLGWRRNDLVTTWCFHQAAAADSALFDDPKLYEKLPFDAIAYAKGAILGHFAMVDMAIQYARIEHRGRAAIIGKDMPKDKLDALERILYRK
jgi:hypothetical protein